MCGVYVSRVRGSGVFTGLRGHDRVLCVLDGSLNDFVCQCLGRTQVGWSTPGVQGTMEVVLTR